MRDIHSHILPGVDDGARTLDESISLLHSLEDAGVTDLVLTPHYIEDSKYVCNVEKKELLLKVLLKEVEKENINIKLYLGNEIYFEDNLLELLDKKEISTINNSRYLLIELPILNMPRETKNVFSELIYSGYKVILAHPERYVYVIDNIKLLDDLVRMGVILQGDYMSLFGKYGRGAMKTLKKLIKSNYISLLASDTHHHVEVDEKRLRKKLEWLAPSTKIEELLNTNFIKVINDEEL